MGQRAFQCKCVWVYCMQTNTQPNGGPIKKKNFIQRQRDCLWSGCLWWFLFFVFGCRFRDSICKWMKKKKKQEDEIETFNQMKCAAPKAANANNATQRCRHSIGSTAIAMHTHKLSKCLSFLIHKFIRFFFLCSLYFHRVRVACLPFASRIVVVVVDI